MRAGLSRLHLQDVNNKAGEELAIVMAGTIRL